MTAGMPRPDVSLWVHFSSIFDGFGLSSLAPTVAYGVGCASSLALLAFFFGALLLPASSTLGDFAFRGRRWL